MTFECFACFLLGAVSGFSLAYLLKARDIRRGLLFRALDLTDAALLGRMIVISGDMYLVIPLKEQKGKL